MLEKHEAVATDGSVYQVGTVELHDNLHQISKELFGFLLGARITQLVVETATYDESAMRAFIRRGGRIILARTAAEEATPLAAIGVVDADPFWSGVHLNPLRDELFWYMQQLLHPDRYNDCPRTKH